MTTCSVEETIRISRANVMIFAKTLALASSIQRAPIPASEECNEATNNDVRVAKHWQTADKI